MKKYFALLLVVFTLALVGTAMAADSDGGHVIPVNPDQPVTPTPGTDTGSETAKTVDAPAAAATTTTTVTVSTVTQTTTTVTKVADTVTYTAKVVVTISRAEVTQTATQAVANKKVEVTTATTTAVTTVIETTSTTTTTTTASTVATQALAALKQASGGSATPATEAEAAADASKTAMLSTLLAGNQTGTSTGSETVDLSLLTSLAETKADGTTETPTETMLRVVNEAADTAARTNTASNPDTASTLTSALATSAGGTAQDVDVVDSSTLDVSDEEPPALDDVMSLLAAQSAQEVSDAQSGSATDQQAAQARQREHSTSTPVAVSRPVGLPAGATKPALVVSPMPTMKPDMYKKRINASAIKSRRGGSSGGHSVTASALDASYSGSGVFLNSIGEVVDRVPGEGEWGTPKGETKRQLIVPGQVSLVMLMEPGETYTPVITTPAEDVSTIEGVSTQAEQETVDVVKTETVTLTIPVYDTASYSTSFDQTEEAAFEAAGYNTAVGMYIVSGDAGAWSATSAADTAMLSSTGRAVVLTLPKLNISGTALPTDCYVMRVVYEIPANTSTQVVSGDNLLDFYPRGLTTTNAAGETVVAATGTAVYLNNDMVPLTDALIRAAAARGVNIEGYIAMTLDASETLYTPVVTVKTTAISGGDTPGGDTPGGDTPGGEVTPINPVNPGSSGGGCDAGFGALALAVLGAFMVTRRK